MLHRFHGKIYAAFYPRPRIREFSYNGPNFAFVSKANPFVHKWRKKVTVFFNIICFVVYISYEPNIYIFVVYKHFFNLEYVIE